MKSPTPQELRELTQTLQSLIDDRLLLNALEEEERVALLTAAGKLAHPQRDEQRRLSKRLRRQKKETLRAVDRTVREKAEIRTLRKEPVFKAPLQPLLPAEATGPARVLETPQRCYVCKASYRELHFFYDAMCRECGDLNYAKRFQKAKLDGKVALITGARVKIGFQASLMLLRSGARVIATTRFPNDAALRYAREADFAEWRHRLQIHGLDLRHAPSVELLARHIAQTHDRLDILINNAAQTVRRPPGFYAHLLQNELLPSESLPPESAALLQDRRELMTRVQGLLGPGESEVPRLDALTPASTPSWRSNDPALGIHSSAALSLVPYAFENERDSDKLFPEGRLDSDLQQVDLRTMNSWRLKLAEVATAEMLEVHLVNAVAPFILCGKLKPLMLRHRSAPGHIVNVSAMEGSFSRGTKTDRHPHTNMAKAALNMMTLTSAPDYAKDGIFMNAVDTGWVTDEDPAALAQRKTETQDFQPPLDIVDGAARVVDPVFVAENTRDFVWGNFFKDYKPTAW